MNPDFLKRIQSYIPDEYKEFEKTLSESMYQGLRVNIKKIETTDFLSNVHFPLEKSQFNDHTFYVHQSLGLHPYHISGLFYLQEPSASAPVSLLDIQEDDIVLDLCAAPGGKSTQIASQLKSGFLVSNEINKKRAMILLSNMERCGIMNMMITNSEPKDLCRKTKACFNKILVDAPCSGEGMMKKHEAAKDEWSIENIEYCAKRQKEILSYAYQSLQKDGILVYSTCTYAKEENEEVVEWFLNTYPDMELVQPDVRFGREGFIKNTIRIFPMDGGEGQFMAKFKKTSGDVKSLPYEKNKKVDPLAERFLKEQIGFVPSNVYENKGRVYVMERPFVKLNNIRQGIYVGDILKNRLEPAHAFYLCSEWMDTYKKKVDVSIQDMDEFMHGQTLSIPIEKGYVAVCINEYPFGFGKSDGRIIKNKIPKGLRLMSSSHVMDI